MESPQATGSGMFEKLDAFVSAAKHLETQLAQERARYRQLQEETIQRQQAHDRSVKEAEIRIRELSIKETRLEAAIDEYRESEGKLLVQVQKVQTEAKKIRDELMQYRAAWAEVLQREREAKLILAESALTQKRMQELETRLKTSELARVTEQNQREQAERHSKTYQAELQSSLVRLHSAEAKFNELTKELQAFRESKANLEEEVSRVEKTIRERLEWEALKDREKMKAELEREFALERETFRAECRDQARAELDRLVTAEREQFMRLREQLEVQRAEFDQYRNEASRNFQQAVARAIEAESGIRAAQSENQRLTAEITRLETEAREAVRAREDAKRVSESIHREKSQTDARAQRLEQDLQEQRERVSQSVAELKAEVELLRSANPIRALIEDKEKEIERARADFEGNLQNPRERTRAEQKLGRLFDDRDRLSGRLVELESGIREQLRRIHTGVAGDIWH